MVAATTAVLAGASLAMTYKGMKDGKKAEKRARAERARLSAIQSDDVLSKGKKEADLILNEALRTRGYQMAQQAASGVVVGDGSSQYMLEETQRLATADALAAIADSEAQSEQIQAGAAYDASASRSRERAIRNNAYANILGTASSAVSNYHSITTTNTGGVT